MHPQAQFTEKKNERERGLVNTYPQVSNANLFIPPTLPLQTFVKPRPPPAIKVTRNVIFGNEFKLFHPSVHPPSVSPIHHCHGEDGTNSN